MGTADALIGVVSTGIAAGTAIRVSKLAFGGRPPKKKRKIRTNIRDFRGLL